MAYSSFVCVLLLSLVAASAFAQAPGPAPTRSPTASAPSPAPKSATPAPAQAPKVDAPTPSPAATPPSVSNPPTSTPTVSPPAPNGPSGNSPTGNPAGAPSSPPGNGAALNRIAVAGYVSGLFATVAFKCESKLIKGVHANDSSPTFILYHGWTKSIGGGCETPHIKEDVFLLPLWRHRGILLLGGGSSSPWEEAGNLLL
ncbi:hypothetical protein EZV62_021907 [Acer yangbiense]|uniref:Uncharacterized protein n=1 Tax=Acer yangbiense TaxID=1000413 RepID=A0A5C7H6R7_9ROSI|nr:hypothetical protein EZV62_021907 [Acer yangbiense]